MPFINEEYRCHAAIAAGEGRSKLNRALAFWQDLIEIYGIHDATPGAFSLPHELIKNFSSTWAMMSTDFQHGDVSIDELRGFAQAFTCGAGFNAELTAWAQEAFEFIGE